VFVFLAFTSVVSIWRDLGNSQLSLATAWCVTNTFILGAFIVIAFKESWYNKHPRDLVPDPIAGITDVVEDEDSSHEALSTMIVRPTLEASAKSGTATIEKTDTDTDVLAAADAAGDDKREAYAK
jgi:cellulose synthase (UDP-forming)